MLLAHCGVAIFVVGVTVVEGYEQTRDVRMTPGDSVTLGAYTFRFDGVQAIDGPNYRAARGRVVALRDGDPVAVLHPEKRIYNAQRSNMTEAAVVSGIFGDLYVALGEPVDDSAWSVRVYHKPLVTWIWGGCIVMALGGFLALTDSRYRGARRREKSAPLAPEAAAAGRYP
jgi:cytochrome c-type biogenesis protein CcmF